MIPMITSTLNDEYMEDIASNHLTKLETMTSINIISVESFGLSGNGCASSELEVQDHI